MFVQVLVRWMPVGLGRNFRNDHELNAAEWIVYDTRGVCCREIVRGGKTDGAFWWALQKS